MMLFYDHCLKMSCSDTVNTSSFYVMYVKIVIAVSKREKDGHAACNILHLRAEAFTQAKDLLTQVESYCDFTSHRHKCWMGLHPNYNNVTITKGRPAHVQVCIASQYMHQVPTTLSL